MEATLALNDMTPATAPPSADLGAIDVCVCTYRRPQLADTLRSLAAQTGLEGWRVKVIVIDNDASPSARDLAERTGAEAGLDLRHVHAPAHNISVARNAFLSEARGDWLAFIDDDELADPSWLSRLLAEAERGGWDAVLGPVDAIYRDDAPAWIRKGDFHSIRPVAVKGELLTGYSCNALVRREAVGNLRFALELGRSGGEDLDFFYRFTDRGGRIGYAADAVVREPTPAARARFDWLVLRRWRYGQSHGDRLAATQGGPIARPKAAALAAAKACCYAALTAIFAASEVRRRRYAMGVVLHAGVVNRLLGGRMVQIYGGGAAARPSAPVAASETAA